MWGNPDRAASLTGSDTLASLLYQICSPAHIPWGDERWRELLHGYDVWIHLDDAHQLVQQYAQNMAKHAEMSSNLASLSLHVTRMMRELVRDIKMTQTQAGGDPTTKFSGGAATTGPSPAAVDDFSIRISRVAKARAIAGSLQLLQLLSHSVIVHICTTAKTPAEGLNEAFTYHTRGDLPLDQPAGVPLVHSILDLITVVGPDPKALNTPEIYDTVVMAFQVLFVLCGTQLYQPFRSSFETATPIHGILESMFQQDDGDNYIEEHSNLQTLWMSSRSSMSINSANKKNGNPSRKRRIWSPRAVLAICLEWQLNRPPAPEGSLSHYYYVLAQAAVNVRGGEKPGTDGLYETYMVVQSTAPNYNQNISKEDPNPNSSQLSGIGAPNGGTHNIISRGSSETQNIILDATRGVLTLGGKIILLPFRLVSLVVGVFVSNKKGSHQLRQGEMIKKFASARTSRTRDVLWLSDSLIADLASSMILLLANNKRNPEQNNPFRFQLKRLSDNRWDGDDEALALPDLPNFGSGGSGSFSPSNSFRINDFEKARKGDTALQPNDDHSLSLNFEALFVSFGQTLHTEVGALLLYTLLQSSPSFAESLAVRSDLDTLVMPLLRTLYFASTSHSYVSKDYVSRRPSSAPTSETSAISATTGPQFDIRSCPFRSLSQLYVIIILLLLFSQDLSFGRDAFKRISVSNVLWYKERHLRNINLGSVLLLTLLRSLLFNLNRLNDVFMLSNCCAVLMNLSSSVAGLHEYAAMRLASVAVMVMKKHAKLEEASPKPNGRQKTRRTSDVEEDDISSPLEMYAEVAHTLLAIIKQGLSSDNIEENVHLIYALVYHQMDLTRLCKNKNLYSSKETERIEGVTLKASSLIQNEGARTAPKALKVLESHVDDLVAACHASDAKVPGKRRRNAGEEDFTFTYEEETDPEIFFVPYVWEVIVCCTTSTTISWKKDNIQAFALLDKAEEDVHGANGGSTSMTDETFAENADELV